jgi:transposase
LAYDTNVISSYSQTLNLSNYGVNNEYDPIAQINLVLLLGKTSRLPVCYHKLPGKISDVTTIKNLLIDLKYLNINSIKLVLDNEFYSQANINLLYSCDYKFLFAGKLSLKYIQKELSLLRDTMMQNRNYSSKHSLYCQSVSIPWSFQKSNKEIATHPLYLHFYYNDQRASDEKNSLNTLLEKLEEELMCDKIDPKNEKLYLQYFTITQIEDTTQDGKITIKKIISLNEDAITTKIKNFGYFVLMSNSISSAKEAIRIYRSKDLIKKGYGNFKNRLSIKGTLVSSEESLDGKIFVQFVALILVSFIKQQMDKYNLFKQYTFQEAIDELDTIERLTLPNNTIISEVTKKQQELYKLFGVDIIS